MFEKYKDSEDVYIIAEVGQNHQGDLATAKTYVEEFTRLGANAIKFQMRNNEYLFSEEAFNRPYDNENSFGKSYGEHRNYLEFSNDEWVELRSICKQFNVDFMCTPFDEPSLQQLISLDVDLLKVSSFDLANIPLLSKICASGKPIVVSVGGGKLHHIESTIEYLQRNKADFALLHCVSEYPCPINKLGLGFIAQLKQQHPSLTVGLSDHFNGILSGPLGYMNGARVFEKHVTFNRANKGTDHNFALEPRGFENFVRDIKRAPKMNRINNYTEVGNEAVFNKLGKSICASVHIDAGAEFTTENIRGIIDMQAGVPVRESEKLIGLKAKRPYRRDELIDWQEMEL